MSSQCLEKGGRRSSERESRAAQIQIALARIMHFRPTFLAVLVTLTCVWPFSASAKRPAPKPVPPVVFQGVEYRAPLSVARMGHVEAVEVATGKKLWDTMVYQVWRNPLAEEDNQWVFITSLLIRDRKLLVSNENGTRFRIDLKTGHVEGAIRYWLPWFCLGAVLLVAGLLFWKRLWDAQRTIAGANVDCCRDSNADLNHAKACLN